MSWYQRVRHDVYELVYCFSSTWTISRVVGLSVLYAYYMGSRHDLIDV